MFYTVVFEGEGEERGRFICFVFVAQKSCKNVTRLTKKKKFTKIPYTSTGGITHMGAEMLMVLRRGERSEMRDS